MCLFLNENQARCSGAARADELDQIGLPARIGRPPRANLNQPAAMPDVNMPQQEAYATKSRGDAPAER